ncbi:hypothetical protein CRUP_038585 [Coryphaenoides rupestris]|nr:hypothetical protein CRUP_038585 [Coryphaenoides rupestris]
MSDSCPAFLVPLMGLGLTLSLGFNMVFCFLQCRKTSQRERVKKTYRGHSSTSSMENGGDHIQDNDHELQENSLYGNIPKARRETEFSVPVGMTTRLDYASLDLKRTKRGKAKTQDVAPEPPLDLRVPEERLFQSGGGAEGGGSATSSSSLYLNRQQIAMEMEEPGGGEAPLGPSRPPAW